MDTRGYADDIIDPRETRACVISALDIPQNKRVSNPPSKGRRHPAVGPGGTDRG